MSAAAPRIGVIALVPDRWDDVVMPRHQVLKRLAKHFPTVWIEPADPWREHLLPGGSGFLRGDAWSEPTPGLDVMRPGWRHPTVYRPARLQRAFMRSRLAAARRRLIERGVDTVVLYLWRDEFAAATGLVAHDASCYHVDDEYSFSDQDQPNSPRETELLRQVDQVIVHSEALFEKKGSLNPHTALVPNGVDYADFAAPQPVPDDLRGVPAPRIGYAGVIKKQLDLALLSRLAKQRPQASFVLVGPILNVSGKEHHIEALKALPNVHFLGNKPIEQLPAYMQHFDVCLMCYEVNDYTNYIYPLKLNEYLATGRPVVSSPIHAISRLGHVVRIANDNAQWNASIDEALGADALDPERVRVRRAHAREHDWNRLVDRIAELFRSAVARRRGAGNRAAGANDNPAKEHSNA